MSKNHLYINLYENLKQQIIEGQYESEDKFPSKRVLGQHLSVSNTTIEHAYQLLLDEGYIYSKPRSGYFVSDIETLPIVTRNPDQFYAQNHSKNNHDALQSNHSLAVSYTHLTLPTIYSV